MLEVCLPAALLLNVLSTTYMVHILRYFQCFFLRPQGMRPDRNTACLLTKPRSLHEYRCSNWCPTKVSGIVPGAEQTLSDWALGC